MLGRSFSGNGGGASSSMNIDLPFEAAACRLPLGFAFSTSSSGSSSSSCSSARRRASLSAIASAFARSRRKRRAWMRAASSRAISERDDLYPLSAPSLRSLNSTAWTAGPPTANTEAGACGTSPSIASAVMFVNLRGVRRTGASSETIRRNPVVVRTVRTDGSVALAFVRRFGVTRPAFITALRAAARSASSCTLDLSSPNGRRNTFMCL